MEFAKFEKVNDSLRTQYSVMRGDDLVDLFKIDYLNGDPDENVDSLMRAERLVDARGLVEGVCPFIHRSQVWLEVVVQIQSRDYPDRL